MSGIAVLLASHGAPVDQALLGAMTAAQRFRGPDGEATWYGASIGLGHTLHKTTVESEHERQPASLDGRVFITADARVDDRHALCARLHGRGREVRSDVPDSTLLLHAYDVWGEAFLEHILGDFSFALWDAPRRRLVCAVDQLGVKPFYYANKAGLFAGSNSLECVRLHPAVRSELNPSAVGDFLLWGCYLDRSVTIYADIARIPPGHFLVLEAGELRLQRYFSIPQPAEVRFTSADACVEQFQEVLEHAVRDRLRTRRVAAFMSGGVDSPLVAKTAKSLLARDGADHTLEAFTFGYDTLVQDRERHYAGLVGESLGIPVHFHSFDDAGVFDWPETFVSPEPNHLPALRPWIEQTVTVAAKFSTVLTGWDGDALLQAATRRHWPERWKQRRFGALARDLAWYVRHQRALPPVGLRTALASWRHEHSLPPRPTWLRDDFWARTDLGTRWASMHAPPHVVGSRDPSPANFASPGWGRIFDHHDPGCMGVALEARHPLADLRVIRFSLGLPAVPWCIDKHLLRLSLRGLPKAVRLRPKTPLPGDIDLVRYRMRGLGRAASSWRGAAALDQFVDTVAVQKVLSQPSPPAEQLQRALWTVAFGAWLDARSVVRSAPGRDGFRPLSTHAKI